MSRSPEKKELRAVVYVPVAGKCMAQNTRLNMVLKWLHDVRRPFTCLPVCGVIF